MTPLHPVSAITLDLDDTLWPVWPNILKAEDELHAWIARHAPRTAARSDRAALRAQRNAVLEAHPEWAHDLGKLRREAIRLALIDAGDDPALADAGFAVFYAARQRVTMFDDALPALQRLAERYPIMAVTNGNADIAMIGIDRYFQGSVTAHEVGVGKPDARIFHEACRRLKRKPAEVLHVGDDGLLDVAGAIDAGLQAAWIDRSESIATGALAEVARYTDLSLLADALGC
jgi:HAD superfamily hydrolase (TIGR01509 family)